MKISRCIPSTCIENRIHDPLMQRMFTCFRNFSLKHWRTFSSRVTTETSGVQRP